MRPDEHKKKKNTQYKKKHGVPDKENKTETRTKHTVDDKKENSQGKVVDHSKPTEVKDVEEDAAEEDRQYRKRKLVSNWSRYADTSGSEDEDFPLQRGEDFNKLLAEAGGSATQFRFKDEEEWAVENQDTNTTFLGLDFENLSFSLSSIPLHDRLGIEQHLFTEEQTEEMKMKAVEMKKKYMEISGQESQDQTNSEEIGAVRHKGPVLSKESENVSVNPVRQSETSEIKITDTKGFTDISTEQIAVISNEQNTEASQAKHKADIEHTDKGTVHHKTGSKEVAHLEDDLDFILSLDSCNDMKTEQLNDSNTQVQDNKNSNRTKEAVASKIHVNSSETVKTDGKTIKGNVNLEDWLDSMLDD